MPGLAKLQRGIGSSVERSFWAGRAPKTNGGSQLCSGGSLY
jgi:hypothetical protein